MVTNANNIFFTYQISCEMGKAMICWSPLVEIGHSNSLEIGPCNPSETETKEKIATDERRRKSNQKIRYKHKRMMFVYKSLYRPTTFLLKRCVQCILRISRAH